MTFFPFKIYSSTFFPFSNFTTKMSNCNIFSNSTFFPWPQKRKKCRFDIFAIRLFSDYLKKIAKNTWHKVKWSKMSITKTKQVTFCLFSTNTAFRSLLFHPPSTLLCDALKQTGRIVNLPPWQHSRSPHYQGLLTMSDQTILSFLVCRGGFMQKTNSTLKILGFVSKASLDFYFRQDIDNFALSLNRA